MVPLHLSDHHLRATDSSSGPGISKLFGNCKEEWFKSFLELPNGIPSHDTFGDVFARLDPEQFQRCFMEWVQAVAQVTQGEVVAIDGKTVRRSHDRTLGKKAIHMVNVWASSHGLALGQTKVDEKSNEITAIPKLLQLLELADAFKVAVIGCSLLLAVHWTLGTVHIQDYSPV